jgi:hypothetical protein
MEKKADNVHDDEWLKNLPVQAEEIAFKPEDMISCGACRRTSPPNRLACFYCGKPLEISDAQAKNLKPNLRKLEVWEKGFNLIYKPDEKGKSFEKAAKFISLEAEMLEKICAAKTVLPLARV